MAADEGSSGTGARPGGSSGSSTGGTGGSSPSLGSGGSGGGAGKGGTGTGGGAPVPPGNDIIDDGEDSGGAGGEGGEDPPVPPSVPPATNPFVLTAHDPLSTFAADVDTASYDIFRRDVNRGVLPAPTTVRLEEYVNYFAYDYEPPALDAEHPFSIHLGAAPSLFESGTTMLRVGIQGVTPERDEAKQPANLVFLVDVSGSMASSEKLPLVQLTLTEALDVLEPSDTVSIVTYAGSTAVRLEPTPVAERATIEAVIDALGAGGATAGGAGITLAYQQAEAGFIEGGINHVVLCTDGDFNVGVSSTSALVNLIVEKRRTGITLTVLGYGNDNLNDSMMEAISNAGNGVYGVISNADQAIEYVNQRLLSTLIHIAKDMKIQVEFNPEHVYAYRLLGYENRAIADDDFRDDLIDAGEIGAGHRVTALYELVPAGGMLPMPEGAPPAEDGDAYAGAVEVAAEDFVLVKVRYKSPDASEEDPAFEVATSLGPDAVAEKATDLGSDFAWALSVASFAEILKQSPYADPSRISAITALVELPEQLTHSDRGEFATLYSRALNLLPAR